MAERVPMINAYLVAAALAEAVQSQNELNRMVAENVTSHDHRLHGLIQVLIDKGLMEPDDLRSINKITASKAAKMDQALAGHRQQMLNVQGDNHPALTKVVNILAQIAATQRGPDAHS